MSDEGLVKFPDKLRVEGVMCDGFGIICKFPMLDTDLSIGAKAVYALICSYAGNGTTAFPSRDKIMGHLKIGKEKYYSAMRQLKEQGYVTVEKKTLANGQFGNNVYTIVSNPKKFAESDYESNGGSLSTTFGFTGLMLAGYGTIPRAVMFDTRLSVTAKVLYAYLASFSGAGKVAFPKTKHIQYHLGISQNTYQRHMQQLVKLNYVSCIQRHVNGLLSANDYRLNAQPDEAAVPSAGERQKQKRVIINQQKPKRPSQLPQNKDTVQLPQNRDMDQLPQNEDTVYQDTVHQDTDIRPIIINSSLKNNSSKIKPSLNSGQRHWTDGMSRGEIIDLITAEWEYDAVIQYHNLHISREQILYIMNIVVDFILSNEPILRVRNVSHNRTEVIDRFLGLSCEDIEYVCNKINAVRGKIKNLRKYYLVCLYSAREDLEAETQRQVALDMQQDII